jgi:hypothetical protein
VNSIGVWFSVERAIDLRHHIRARSSLDADHDAIGMLEIVDRRAFAQELGIGRDVESAASGPTSRMMRSTSSPVPTGTVDLVTTTV